MRRRRERLDKSDSMEEATPGNWILTATRWPVVFSVARCTCPIEADAIGVRSNWANRDVSQSGPSSSRRTLSICQSGM